ncbi:response regulator transcription factor [Sporosalibacterium faouarense]|uniref:response regulator transcription factor n=1 Tax=Sporosalibacterium faouarense TaxID=516123 RepID=UPI00141C0754|nr:response regulator transcription factor [Sporosalibacterium faouarense]MTI48410.1 response regulator transcription factor [Bacillota bacterium]
MYRIMVVEDNNTLCKEISLGLEKWGFSVIMNIDFNNLLKDFSKHDPHLVIMDVNLPYLDGFTWCKKIREISKVPIIFLSSRDTNMDIVMAINMGGDDYITKPFSMDVLLAKINGLLRRTYSYGDDTHEVIEHNNLILNVYDNSILYDDKKCSLTKNEFRILYLLMNENGKIISRDKIMRALWNDESFIDDNTLTVNINRLRKKLNDLGLNNFITTKKGQGYVIL